MSNITKDNQCAANTDRELWREREGDYYADSIHVTAQGAIGINCGGYIYFKPLREWFKLAGGPFPAMPDAPPTSNDCLSDTPPVTEPRRMNLEEAVKWAMEGETRLIDAEVKLCIWETERIVKQARANPKWETCFHRCLWDLHEAWAKSGRDFAKSVPVPVAWMNRVGLVSSTKQGGYDIPLFPSTAPEPPQPGAKTELVSQLRGDAAMHRHYGRDWSAELMDKAAAEIEHMGGAPETPAKPIAWMYRSSRATDLVTVPWGDELLSMCLPDMEIIPLYAGPVQINRPAQKAAAEQPNVNLEGQKAAEVSQPEKATPLAARCPECGVRQDIDGAWHKRGCSALL